MSLLYSQYGNRNVVDSVETRGEPTFKFKEGVREIKLQEFEDYWKNPEKAQWGQIWELMQNFALEDLRKRRPCHDCPQYKELTKF
ncbi:MAG TPA: hypothetical protein PLK34_01495 [Candidatus Pacearchaeota archaeon]|nr:hypothetical protein [Candidatus Pacearchaeota archaeon]